MDEGAAQPVSSPPDVVIARSLRELVRLAKATAAEMVDVDGLALMLSVSPRRVEQMHKAGLIPKPNRIGRLRRWPREHVRQWIAAGCPPADQYRARRHLEESRKRTAAIAAAAADAT